MTKRPKLVLNSQAMRTAAKKRGMTWRMVADLSAIDYQLLYTWYRCHTDISNRRTSEIKRVCDVLHLSWEEMVVEQ